jgi:hypothetical protein
LKVLNSIFTPPPYTTKPVPGFRDDDPVVGMAAGDAVSAAVTASGAMYAWGSGDGPPMLGKGDDGDDDNAPRRLTASARFAAAGGIAVSLGGQHAAWLAAAAAEDAPQAPAAKMRREE